MEDMQQLRNELKNIKKLIQSTAALKKELEQVKSENNNLKRENELMKVEVNTLTHQVEEVTQENLLVKHKGKGAESILIDSESKCEPFDINPLIFAKESRRQELANKYESFSFVPSVACLSCKRKDEELESIKNRHNR
jgi:regulator of replication initiation timing